MFSLNAVLLFECYVDMRLYTDKRRTELQWSNFLTWNVIFKYFPFQFCSRNISGPFALKRLLEKPCSYVALCVMVIETFRAGGSGGGGSRQVYTYETLLQYADSPLSKPPPAGLAAFPAELARKVTPRRAPPAPLACPSLPPHRLRSAWPPLHHPNYLAALLCRNFY